MSFVSGQRITLQMLHLGKKGERERIPNKAQDDLRKSDLFQGKWFNSYFHLPEHGLLVRRQPLAMVPEGVSESVRPSPVQAAAQWLWAVTAGPRTAGRLEGGTGSALGRRKQ